MLAHPTGYAEIWIGAADGAKIELQTDVVARTADGQGVHRRAPALRPGRRRPALGLRHGGGGPAAAAAPVRPARSRVAVMSEAPTVDCGRPLRRAQGYRLTPQRQLVLEAVAALGHATPDEICAEVRKTARGVNISTVYRTLELLEELGLVTHAHLGHGAPTYHLADRRRPPAPGLPRLRRRSPRPSVALADAAGRRAGASSTASRPTWGTSRSSAAARTARRAASRSRRDASA